MVTFWLVISWTFSILFAFIAVAMFGMGGRLQAVLFLGIVLLLLPPFRAFIHNITGKSLPWWARGLLIIILWGGVMLSFLLNPATSIYKSPEYEAQLMDIYDAKMAEWPVPYEDVYVDTDYGKVHVIVSGPEDVPPLLLIHASAVAGWSWLYNVEELGKHYRIYAVDSIGDVGKSVLNDLTKPLEGGEEIARFYTDLTNKLGFNQSYLAGASIGGYIATNYALYAPERVKKLVLLGSMGYGSTNTTVMLMVLAQSFPLRWVQERTLKWALGDSPHVIENFGGWFYLILKGTMPKPTPPKSFTPDQLRQMQVPVLTFFGTKDKVIGDAQKARALAENIPDVQVEIVESGHLIGAELPDIVNPAMREFFADN
jgi:pimeloyl-ACP methyl ester carboxylesterase